jgi:hypothetical protein
MTRPFPRAPVQIRPAQPRDLVPSQSWPAHVSPPSSRQWRSLHATGSGQATPRRTPAPKTGRFCAPRPQRTCDQRSDTPIDSELLIRPILTQLPLQASGPASPARPGTSLTADLRQDSPMADRYRTPDDWTVEVVELPKGDRLRIRHRGFYVADVVNVDDLARWIPAAELAQLERDTLILAAKATSCNTGPGPDRLTRNWLTGAHSHIAEWEGCLRRNGVINKAAVHPSVWCMFARLRRAG